MSWVERLVDESAAPRTAGLTSKVPIVREKVAEARESLLFVAHLLRHERHVRPRGIAMVERLLSDGGSVIYTDSAQGAVELQVQVALGFLGPLEERDATSEDAAPHP